MDVLLNLISPTYLMELSIFLAQILGLVYIVTGLGIIADKSRFRALYDEMLRDAPLIYVMGMSSLVVGYIIVAFHNIWVSEWPVLITIVGWLALIKGVLIVVAPKVVLKRGRFWLTRMNLAGLATLVLGLVLGYFGFLA